MGVLENWTMYYPGSRHKIEVPGGQVDSLNTPRWDDNPKVYKVKGVDTEFFTIGQLGMALGGRKPVTIRKWETQGIIPKPTFRKPSEDPRGQRRLYSRAQVEGLVKIAEEEGVLMMHSKPIAKTNFTKRAIALFKELSNV